MENSLFNKLIKQEKQLIAKSDDFEYLSSLIDDEFTEVGAVSGFLNKDDVLRWLGKPSTSIRSGMQFKAQKITEDVVLITYMTNIKNSENAASVLEIRTSIWRCRNEEWKLIFHQATPVH